MGISVARLRMGLAVGVVLLVAVVAGFLGYARYRTHRFLAGLPGKLGLHVIRETNGYTFSQSVGQDTRMTLHASKAVEFADGKITLHDVRMTLYGRKQNREDQISGSEFEFEQKTGVVKAVGEVHIDLQAPAVSQEGRGKSAIAPLEPDQTEEPGGEGKRLIHVKTSGLVYLQKLGIAATDQPLEFQFNGMTGHAVGAEYNSDTGIVILQSAVKANGLQRGTPVVLTATHAELDRQGQQAVLTEAKYASPRQTARGDHAVMHLRADGSPERIEAEGNVALERPGAGRMTAPRGDVSLNAAGQARDAHFYGGVGYTDTASLREARGEAQDARVSFNEIGQPQDVMLTGAVHVNERVRAVNTGWSTRDAVAGAMTFALTPDGRRQQLRSVDAVTAARVVLVSEAGTTRESRSEIAGDRLRGDFAGSGTSAQLTEVRGSGHTSLRRAGPMDAEQTSAGDTLQVNLRPSGKGDLAQVSRAVQTGHVTLTSRAAAKPGAAPSPLERAIADLAVYDGTANHLTLTGHAQVTDPQGTVAAETIVLEHASGDATATGTVKATYVQSTGDKAAEPTHVSADHAELQHNARRAIFHGAVGGKPARMWQGGSQVEAPVLDLEQQAGRLTARGETAALSAAPSAAPVHAVLVGQTTAGGNQGQTLSVVRVASRTMVYLDAARQVDFRGGVKVEDADGTLHAQQATAYLRDAAGPGTSAPKQTQDASKEPGLFSGGSVDRIVATGAIQMDQPGRKGVGERLVYTAADSQFVLTGTPGAPPRLVDEAQGTVTGQALRFHSGDKSVKVTGGDAAQPGQRVHTVTRVQQP